VRKVVGMVTGGVLLLSMIVLLAAINGKVSGIVFTAVVAPIAVLAACFLAAFVVAAVQLISNSNVSKVIQFVLGGLTGATVADATEWRDAVVAFLREPGVSPPVMYVATVCVLFGLCGLILGLWLGREEQDDVRKDGIDSVPALLTSMIQLPPRE
jgi:hypothetical protein